MHNPSAMFHTKSVKNNQDASGEPVKRGAQGGTLGPKAKLNTALPYKENKFSAFLKGGEKDYTVKDEWKNFTKHPVPKWTDKEEYSRIPFDPNIRHRIPQMSNSLVYRALGEVPWEPLYDPQSMYVA